jgi:hypothetical protein
MVDTQDCFIVANANQEVSSFGIQERRNCLEDRVGDLPLVQPVFLEIPSQARLELQRFGFPAASAVPRPDDGYAGIGQRGSS